MATNSSLFPLQNSIRKILDDPNSRPKLPSLDEGSTVGDDKFGEADNYDTGKWSDIALNNRNVVVEVHNTTDSKSLYYRVGEVNGGKIDWGENHYYDKGVNPSVAITDDGLVIEVHKSQGLNNALWYCIGNVEGNEIKWRNDGNSIENDANSIEYDSGQDPSVAINNNGLVVEVHKSVNIVGTNDRLWYRLGQVNGDIIDWRNHGDSAEYDDGQTPSVCITDDGLVVEAHSSSGQLLYRLGSVEDKIINWRNTDKRHYANGSFPSVAITSDGLVVEVSSFSTVPLPTNPSPASTLWHHRGQVNGDTIDWVNDGIEYGDGTTARVACNEQLAVETHSGEDNQLLSSVLTLPAFQGKWIALEGDNSYCYCACNSATDNKDRHTSSHTMNIKEGAPCFYAVLTKDGDSIDFPTGAVLTIEGADGTKYDRDIQEENQLVIMSGSSVRCLIVKDPKPGDWKMTMTVPGGVGFHCECNTVPSKDPYKTIMSTLSQTNQLRKRGSDEISKTISGWLGAAATVLAVLWSIGKGATKGAEIGEVGGPAGVAVGAVVGGGVGGFTAGEAVEQANNILQSMVTPSPTQTAYNFGEASRTASTQVSATPTPQTGRFNLLMGERPGGIYRNLLNFNTDLTMQGRNQNDFPVEMTRHHIVPYNQLRTFWNRMVQEGHLTNAANPLFNNIIDVLRDSHTSFTLNLADREQVIQLLEDIRGGRVTHDANGSSPDGWDSFQGFYAWMPGNLFIGPGGAFRTDDPGEGFEQNAVVVIGRRGFTQYQEAHDRITEYERNPSRGLAQQIAGTLGNIASRRRQPFDINPNHWFRLPSNGRYRLILLA